MDKTELNNKVLNLLKEIFENTNKWLHFAEAKNGVLLALNGAFLCSFIENLPQKQNGQLDYYLLYATIISLTLASIFSIYSFLPKLKSFRKKSGFKHNVELCLLFFKDISKYENSSYFLKDVYLNYFNNKIEFNELKKLEKDYAEQIYVNSNIALKKYNLFKLSLVISFFGWSTFLLKILHVHIFFNI